MSTRNKISFAVFFGLCVLAIAGVVYGVVTHEEPGFMDHTPGWRPSDFPLDVCVHTFPIAPGVDSWDLDHAEQNVRVVDDRLGFDAYRVAGDSEDSCDVLVIYSAPVDVHSSYPVENDPGGSAIIYDRNCEISLHGVSGELRSLTLQHELGHCLGLDHDDSDSSIMRRAQHLTEDGQYPPRISDHDRGIIRDRYLSR